MEKNEQSSVSEFWGHLQAGLANDGDVWNDSWRDNVDEGPLSPFS